MKTLVIKFGGASVAAPDHFSMLSDIILDRKKTYERIAVVVSAMANATDQLVSLAKQVNPEPPRREYDMLVSVGERISISLLAMALAAKGQHAVSFTGSQSGVITCGRHSDARIIDVRPHRLIPVLDSGAVVIVAGFQGVSRKGEITTLGRGGSDTSAIALAVALGAAKTEFYKDVEGVYSADPKRCPDARLFPSMTFDEALALTEAGAKVLHARSVALAKKNGMPMHIKSFNHWSIKSVSGTMIGDVNQVRETPPSYEQEGELC